MRTMLVLCIGVLFGCSGCITLRCPEPQKTQEGTPLPPQDDRAKVIQTGQRSGDRR